MFPQPQYNAGGPGPGGLAPEPISGDSLTQFIRSLGNLSAGQGQQTFQTGQGGYQAGIQQAESGVNAMAPALDYFTRLVKGDQADVQQTLAPQFQSIDQQFGAIRNLISSQPRGGGKTAALAEAPFEAAKQKQNLASQARSAAAPGLTAAAGQVAQTGTELGRLGLAESGQGMQGIMEAIQAALGRRGQNASTDASNLGMLTAGLSNVFNSLI